jgi:hypothetical protein
MQDAFGQALKYVRAMDAPPPSLIFRDVDGCSPIPAAALALFDRQPEELNVLALVALQNAPSSTLRTPKPAESLVAQRPTVAFGIDDVTVRSALAETAGQIVVRRCHPASP